MVDLFLNLLKNDEFRRGFIDTYCLVAGSVFERNRAIGIVDELADAMRPMSEIDGYLPDNAARRIKEKLEKKKILNPNGKQKNVIIWKYMAIVNSEKIVLLLMVKKIFDRK